jgi:hypothetical protein
MTSKLLVVAAASLSLVACIKQDETPEALQRAIPTADQVQIKLKDSGNRVLGQQAEWYEVTRDVTRTFNAGSAWVLILIHTIVQFPPTSVEGDTYEWEMLGKALDPADYRLRVTDNLDGTYGWALQGRARNGGDYEDVITGFADSNPGENRGNGDFKIDFDAGKRVNPIDSEGDARGTVEVNYDLAIRHLDLGIATTSDDGVPLEATYSYDEAADGGGEMTFKIRTDMGQGALLEEAEVASRWNSKGAGRADVSATDGDIMVSVAGVQCWSDGFLSVYEEFSGEGPDARFNASEGNEADCEFQ